MMRAQLEDIRERGEPIAALWASEEVIYGRFGYGMASLAGEIALPSGYTGLRQPPDEPRAHASDQPRRGEDDPPARSTTACAPTTPGMFERTEAWWELRNLCRSARAASGRRREERARCSSWAASRPATRSTASSSKFEYGSSTGTRRGDRGARGRRGRHARALARPARHGLAGDAQGVPPADRPSAPAAAPLSAPDADADRRRALGAARRRRRGALGPRVRR